jgi:hypothetical protein
MSGNGSIAASLPAPDERPLDAYYYSAKRIYVIPKEGGGWVEVNIAGLKLALRECGLSRDGHPISPIDAFTHELHTRYDLDFAGPLAGYRWGFYQMNGRRFLVTSQLNLPVAVNGTCSNIEKLFARWFGEEQLPYILGWLKHAYLNLLPENKAYYPGQMLALCGKPNGGKNFFQDIVTAVLGGRDAKPYRYLCGGTTFNSDLTGAEHLQISDEVGSSKIAVRRKFGSAIKDICVNNQQSIHAKGKEAINLPLRWRLTASLNDRDEDLCVLPPYEPQLWEKIILIKLHHGKELLPPQHERETFWSTILEEIPALCGFLMNYSIPKALTDPRYGVTHYHNPELLIALDAISPELHLHDLIVEKLLEDSITAEWGGTATELHTKLGNKIGFDSLRDITPSAICTGRYLTRLEEKKDQPHVRLDVTNKRTNKKRNYQLTLKPE